MGAGQSYEPNKAWDDIIITEEELIDEAISLSSPSLSTESSREPQNSPSLSITTEVDAMSNASYTSSSDLEVPEHKVERKDDWQKQDNLRLHKGRRRAKSENHRCQAKTRRGRQCPKNGEPLCNDHLDREVRRRFNEIVNLEDYSQLEGYIRNMVQTRMNLEARLAV